MKPQMESRCAIYSPTMLEKPSPVVNIFAWREASSSAQKPFTSSSE